MLNNFWGRRTPLFQSEYCLLFDIKIRIEFWASNEKRFGFCNGKTYKLLHRTRVYYFFSNTLNDNVTIVKVDYSATWDFDMINLLTVSLLLKNNLYNSNISNINANHCLLYLRLLEITHIYFSEQRVVIFNKMAHKIYSTFISSCRITCTKNLCSLDSRLPLCALPTNTNKNVFYTNICYDFLGIRGFLALCKNLRVSIITLKKIR